MLGRVRINPSLGAFDITPRIGTTRIFGSDFPSRVNSLSGSAWLGKSRILGAVQPVMENTRIKNAAIANLRMFIRLGCVS